MEEVFQNNAEGATKEHEIERGFLMLVHQNESTEVHYINRQLVDHIYSCIWAERKFPLSL